MTKHDAAGVAAIMNGEAIHEREGGWVVGVRVVDEVTPLFFVITDKYINLYSSEAAYWNGLAPTVRYKTRKDLI